MHLYDNDIMKLESNKVLKDVSSTGKERPWVDKKLNSIDLADSYKRLSNYHEYLINKYYRVKYCGSYLEFKRFIDDSLKLNRANFCKVRLCPMCGWRRSLKIYGQVSRVMDCIDSNNYRFIFLTLTCRNVPGGDLSKAIDKLFYSFNKFTKRKKFKQSIKGFFRALEVTHNLDKSSLFYDTYHPHIHMVLVVQKSYFKKPELYFTHDDWVNIWKSCLKVDYRPIVHVKRFIDVNGKGVSKGIAEIAKYTVKDTDYIVKDDGRNIDEEMTDSTVLILDEALANRRLISFGGMLYDIHQKLNLDDAEDGDLIHTDNDDDIRDDLKYVIEQYSWNVGYKQYYKVN